MGQFIWKCNKKVFCLIKKVSRKFEKKFEKMFEKLLQKVSKIVLKSQKKLEISQKKFEKV